MTTEQPGYLAYLLRVWRVNDDGKPIWRPHAESPHTGERHGFANLELLFAFLEEETAELAQREEQTKDIGENRGYRPAYRHPILRSCCPSLPGSAAIGRRGRSSARSFPWPPVPAPRASLLNH